MHDVRRLAKEEVSECVSVCECVASTTDDGDAYVNL